MSWTNDNSLEFAFDDAKGKTWTFYSNWSNSDGFRRVAVTRKRGTATQEIMRKRTITYNDENGKQQTQEFQVVESVVASTWDDIRFYIDGVERGTSRYSGAPPRGHADPLEIGRVWRGSLATTAQSKVSEVRLWKTALDASKIGGPLDARAGGLVACWTFQENAGNITRDVCGGNHARLRDARWCRTPDPSGSKLGLYVNGQPQPFDLGAGDLLTSPNVLGKPLKLGTSLVGSLEEVRVWRIVRTQEQIVDNLFTRLKGDRGDLLAYYTFDSDSTAPGATQVTDEGPRGAHLDLSAAPARRPQVVLSTAPISSDAAEIRSALAGVRTAFHRTIDGAPSAAEYGDSQYDSNGEFRGVMKRCYAYIRGGTWSLVTGYKVGDLVREWVGQAQFDPQIVGYVEGAPPVPSENMTPAGQMNPEDDGFSGASRVEFIQADEVTYSASSTKEESVHTSLAVTVTEAAGTDQLMITAPLGIGTAQPLVEVKEELSAGFSLEFERGWSNETAVSQGTSTERNLSVALKGFWEDPKNLKAPAMGRRFTPENHGFALVQSETADVFALRLAHNGALVAYRMQPNPDIPRDWNIVPFPINPRYTKQGTLDGCIGFSETGKICDPDYPNARDYGEYSYFKPREAYALKRRIVREQLELADYYSNASVDPMTSSAADRAASALRGVVGELPAMPGGEAKQREAAEGVARRSLANTYVWTAAGGFFSEASASLDSVTDTAAGSYTLSGSASTSIGFEVAVVGVGLGVQVDASVGGSLSVTRTRTTEALRTFSLNVTCEVPGDLQRYDSNRLQVFDAQGRPTLTPGKVDAYRFMTFYLDASHDNFDDFYNKVVDPIWLEQSSHPNAIALRQARQANKKPPCWRVLHRVTFVSRLLPPVPPPGAPPVEKAMRASNIASNYELIRRLDPLVKDRATSLASLTAATRQALTTYLPELVPHQDAPVGPAQRHQSAIESRRE